jgi:hypothetical protein
VRRVTCGDEWFDQSDRNGAHLLSQQLLSHRSKSQAGWLDSPPTGPVNGSFQNSPQGLM